MSRPGPRATPSGATPGHREELEELEDEAIIAHQTAAHLPQRRARVAHEQRSVVIAEEAVPASQPYRQEHGEKTVVVRDRRELDAARNKILARRRRGKGPARSLLLGLALVAFAIGGFVAFVSFRALGGGKLGSALPAQLVAEVKRPSPAARASGQAPAIERPTPKVSLDELPLERPRRH